MVVITIITIIIIATLDITAAICDEILRFNQQYCICCTVFGIAAYVVAGGGLLLLS